jgi:hypothetical protein
MRPREPVEKEKEKEKEASPRSEVTVDRVGSAEPDDTTIPNEDDETTDNDSPLDVLEDFLHNNTPTDLAQQTRSMNDRQYRALQALLFDLGYRNNAT